MKTLYLDLFSGISGDMFLGAMIDLGVEPAQLERELAKLHVPGWHLHVGRELRGGMAGVRVEVHLPQDPVHHHGPEHGHGHRHDHGDGHGRSFADIREILEASALNTWVKAKALAVFSRVAVAEGRIHGRPADAVHFHEVGALDSIVDTVGGCVALDLLGRPQVAASAVLEGTGSVRCAHGRLPLPAPATLEILAARGVPVTQCEEPHELVTPTGAALLAEFAQSFGPMPGLKPSRVGYGLGSRENQSRPNVLRAVLGEEAASAEHDWETDRIVVLETNLDDVSSEILGGVMEKALAAGALDVFHTAIQMKKSRPGVLLSLLCEAGEADRFTELLLRETSAFGVRRTSAERRKLRREIVQVPTAYGAVEVKLGRLDGAVVQAAPEYESCRQAASAHGVPLKLVYEAALRARQPETGRPGRRIQPRRGGRKRQ
jgi:pyridinium-3,5-bisthiocarboxylic acid mononucleotide nickel chelatase